MLVFGDHRQTADPQQCIGELHTQLASIAAMPPGFARHSKLVAALIDAGALLQGLADADFDTVRQDRWTPATDALTDFLQALGAAVRLSWESRFESIGILPVFPDLAELPPAVELRIPEGFAFYAVYPEACIEAARKMTLTAPARVIGIRTIGTTLAGVVAAALDAVPPVTLRPFGDPFARQICVAPELERELLDGTAHYVIVDEGPGQSGSSFGAVADWLEDRGVPLERIAFLPSHSGPLGPKANERHRRRWDRAQRVAADLGDALPQLLPEWLTRAMGPLDAPLVDISAGEWRQVAPQRQEAPATPAWEKRKFLGAWRGQQLLLKFAGLGPMGERKFAMARALHSAGFIPEPLLLVHGLLVERWLEDGEPLANDEQPVAEIASYIGARARLFPAGDDSGATARQLLDMCRRNVSLGLGDDWAEKLERWQSRLEALSRRAKRVRTDNRLDRHEWLRQADGRLIKTDALDHYCSHDLIGCQDMAWDIAGAIAEFELGADQTRELVGAAERASGRSVDRELLDFCTMAYLAFRLGHAALSAELSDGDPTEAARWRNRADCYASDLRKHLLLERVHTTTRLESSVG